MQNFKIWAVIKKWWLLVLIASFLFSALFYNYISNKQTYTAETMIEYVGAQANGMTPNNKPIDVNEILSSNVIYGAMNDLGLNLSVDTVRNGIKIEPVADEDEETRKLAKLEEGEEYEYFIKRYIVRFTLGADFSNEYVRRILDAVLKNYFTYYATTYVNVRVVPNNCDYALDSNYDYLESVEIIDTTLSTMLSYLEGGLGAGASFRSSKTGYNFSDLHLLYKDLYTLNVHNMYAFVLNHAASKNVNLLVEKYKKKNDDANIQITSLVENIDQISDLKDSYVNKSIEGQQRYTGSSTNSGGSNINTVIEFTDDNSYIDKTTSYDKSVYKQVDYQVLLNVLKTTLVYNQNVIDHFSLNVDKNTVQNRAWIEQELSAVIKQSNALYSILQDTLVDYNEFLAANNVISSSSLRAYPSINTKMYLVIAFLAFLIIGVIGSVGINFLSTLISKTIFFDNKTGLKNRLSLDRFVEKISSVPLSKDTVCIAINAHNLGYLNEKIGREAGDVMLSNLGKIVKACAEGYGDVYYNGGTILCGYFANCDMNKGLLFKGKLERMVSNYNKEFIETPIDISIVVCEAEDSGLYDARTLLRRSISEASVSKLHAKGKEKAQ